MDGDESFCINFAYKYFSQRARPFSSHHTDLMPRLVSRELETARRQSFVGIPLKGLA